MTEGNGGDSLLASMQLGSFKTQLAKYAKLKSGQFLVVFASHVRKRLPQTGSNCTGDWILGPRLHLFIIKFM